MIVQNGGQTPLKLARYLDEQGIPILGTSYQSIDQAEDREKFSALVRELGLKQPESDTARSYEEAMTKAEALGYPLLVRPSYVLGGSAMRIVYEPKELRRYIHDAVAVSHESPVLLDRFLEDAIEVDIDAVCDGENVLIGGIMEHIEQAGVHSGDSSSTLPAYSLNTLVQQELEHQMTLMAKCLKVCGLMNAQFAIKGEELYVIEVNPRASRTVPFVSKTTGLPLAKIAAKCMMGESLTQQGVLARKNLNYYAIKQSVFPFEKFPGVDIILGPEMKSTGEVMGLGRRFGEAFAKGLLGGGMQLPNNKAKAFISVRDADKVGIAEIARQLRDLGFELVATRGTALVLDAAGISCQEVNKVWEGRPNIVDLIKNDEISFIINTSKGRKSSTDSSSMRRHAILHKISYTTTLAGAKAVCMALRYRNEMSVMKLQEVHSHVQSSND